MQVTAFSTAARPEWRWRICDYGGEIVEESHHHFLTIAAAVAQGAGGLAHSDAGHPSEGGAPGPPPSPTFVPSPPAESWGGRGPAGRAAPGSLPECPHASEAAAEYSQT